MQLQKPFDTTRDDYLNDISMLALRLGFGFAMMFGHGWGKLMKLMSGEAIEFMSLFGVLSPKISFGLVVFSEFFCSIFLIFGLFTRWAAFFLFFTMAVAVFYVHMGDPFSKGETGFLYMVCYVAIFMGGAGNYSIDAMLGREV